MADDRPASETFLRERLHSDRSKLEWLIAEAQNHVADCNLFYYRVRLLQRMQIEIVGPIARSDSPCKAFMEASQTGEIGRLQRHDAAYRGYVQSDIAKKVHCLNERLLRYLNLEWFRNEDAYVEKIQERQAALFRTDIRCRFHHRELLRLGDDETLPDGAFDEPTRKKYAEWEANCQALIDYYRTWRDAEIPFVEAFIAEAKQQLGLA